MRRWTVALGFVLLVPTFAGRAFGQDDATARAREAFNRGVELYDQGRTAEALAEFEAAFAARPHPSVRVNMANCHARLGRPVQATYHFRRYLAERGDELTPRQRTDVQREIDGLRMEIAEVQVRRDPESAELFVDGERPTTLIRDVLYLTPGRHVIEARKRGMTTAREELDLAGGSRRTVTLTLSPEPAEAAPVPLVTENPFEESTEEPEPAGGAPAEWHAGPEPEPDVSAGATARVDSGGLREYLPWFAAGGAVLSLGVAAAFGTWALSAEDEFDTTVDAYNASTNPDDRTVLEYNAQEWADAANARALTADIFLVLTVACGAAATYLFLTAPDSERSPSVLATPMLARDGVGLAVAGALTP